MKVIFTISFFLFVSIANAQWTWMKGSNTINKYGVYGTKGVAASTNRPGSRADFTSFTDPNGNLWLFGGSGKAKSTDGQLNDLWKYEPATNKWTWVSGDSVVNIAPVYGTKGIPAITNNPGCRDNNVGWGDASGNLWIFGGEAAHGNGGPQSFNDLWRFEPGTGMWTWMHGSQTGFSPGNYGTQGVASPSNSPRARAGGVGYSDASGNLFLFGGIANVNNPPSYFLNDLWKYSTVTNQWTWLKGTNLMENVAGIYGTRGVPATSNTPGSKAGMTGCADQQGNFWVFGGSGIDSDGTWGGLNDLWKYNPGSNQWTWISGDTMVKVFGVYGSRGVAAATNKPGGRSWSNCGTVANDRFLLFGGLGLAASGTPNSSAGLNDLWEYNKTTDQWTWLTGDSVQNALAVFGTQGVPSPNNKPGTKQEFSSSGWIDLMGNFWIFGGQGSTGSAAFGFLNDLWRYSPVSTVPVSLLSFTGNRDNDVAHLYWKVADELNLDRYEIERSFDDRTYDKTGQVKAMHAGQYSFNDQSKDIIGRNVYYRLRMVDIDAKYSYSKIVALTAGHDGIIAVSPNPATTQVRVQLSKNITGNVDVAVYDLGGRRVTKETYTVDDSGITVPVSQLAGGTYMICVAGNGKKYFERIVVTK